MNHSEAHQSLANEAFSKSGASGLYDRARPTYPIESVNRILDFLPIHDANIVELGAGTGIFTRALLSNSKPGQIKKWNAIEPAAGMRESFNRWLRSYSLKGTSINCDHGTFDCMNSISSGSIDMVIAAQAWHWTGSDPEFQEKCIQEVQRVLNSKGYFVLIWNLKDRERYEWVGRIRDSYELYESGTPQYRLGLWKTLFQTKTFKSSFKLLPPDEVPNPSNSTTTLTFNKNVDDRIDDSIPTLTVLTETPLTLEGLQARILSKSYITVLDSDKQERLRDEIKSIWDHHIIGNLTTDWIDEKTVKFPYVTHLYVLQKW
ncbi:S-adenosyl-L-methionine-dependent methyltransferase [Melampsora americana]|nr:S-adenosyl-L-methionine-dependent methyltransferase [Melampsora americana]